MTDEPVAGPAVASGRSCVAAIRALLTTFPRPDSAPAEEQAAVDIWGFAQDADAMTVYQLVALNAATIRSAGAELARSESEILDELAANFERGSAPEQGRGP
jgi:hypothetical protein